MKKIILYSFTCLLAFSFIPTEGLASSPVKTEMPKDSVVTESSLLNRLAEIKAMDKSNLSSLEKKSNRKETRSIKKQLRDHSYGGIYISVGAVLLIILILILIF